MRRLPFLAVVMVFLNLLPAACSRYETRFSTIPPTYSEAASKYGPGEVYKTIATVQIGDKLAALQSGTSVWWHLKNGYVEAEYSLDGRLLRYRFIPIAGI